VDGYRKLLRENETAQAIFEKVTAEIILPKASDEIGQSARVMQNGCGL
jgi:hypothetical protein